MKVFWKVMACICVCISFLGYDIDNGAAAIFSYTAIVFAIFSAGEKE